MAPVLGIRIAAAKLVLRSEVSLFWWRGRKRKSRGVQVRWRKREEMRRLLLWCSRIGTKEGERERECGGSSHGEDEEQRELASPVLGVNRRGQRWFLMGEDKGEAGLLLLPSKV